MKYKLKIVLQTNETIVTRCEDFESTLLIIGLAGNRFDWFEWSIVILLPFEEFEICRGSYGRKG